MKTVTLGTGLAFWGDALRPAKEMVERADIDYLDEVRAAHRALWRAGITADFVSPSAALSRRRSSCGERWGSARPR